MFIARLHLQNFRNYHDQLLEFTSPKTILVGDNAQGKSNVLEAIFLLAVLKSHRVSRDRDLIREGASAGQITAQVYKHEYGTNKPYELKIIFRSGSKRTLSINAVNVNRQSDFLGNFHAVLFSCLDLELVRHSPEVRRQWLDNILLQLEPIYTTLINEYQQVLRQRNVLLKHLKQGYSSYDPEEMAVWDSQLINLAVKIMRRRFRLLERLAPLAQQWHDRISGGKELLNISYAPKLECTDWQSPEAIQTALLEQLQQKYKLEQLQGTTLVGPHRDDVYFQINHTPAKEYGSQGQQRTLVLALKLAELELVEMVVKVTPVLLLDDVLAELDLHRQNQLLSVIGDRIQTIVTTTHLHNFDQQWRQSAQILRVHQALVQPFDGR